MDHMNGFMVRKVYPNGDTIDDRMWWALVTHGRGLDDLSVENKLEANQRFAHRNTGPMFPEVVEPVSGSTVTLADNLTIGVGA